MPSVPSSMTTHRCTTAGASIVPLVPLTRSLEVCLALPNPSRWLIQTVRLGYVIQFARQLPRFSGVLRWQLEMPLSCATRLLSYWRRMQSRPVPPAEMKSGFYSPYFIMPKKGGGLRPILDLRVLNRALHKLIRCIQPQDWSVAVDLKDAYFHVSILPRHWPCLLFVFVGRAWQYRVVLFGCPCPPVSLPRSQRAPLPCYEKGHQDPQLPR